MADWNFTDYRDEPLPKPVNWDDHPEWFYGASGKARRMPGPRFVPQGTEERWHWGPTEWVRQIGEYVILAFREDRSTFSQSQQADHGVLAYAVWVDGVKLDLTWESLDAALVDMVRFKYEGARGSSGPRATEYFLKMIDALKE